MTLEMRSEGNETVARTDLQRAARLKNKRNWRIGRLSDKNIKQRGFGLVEKIFYYYKSIRKEVEAIRAEKGYYQNGHKEGGSGSGHSFISNPTEQIAIKHIAPVSSVIIRADKLDEEVVKHPEKWMKVVEQTLAFFNDEYEVEQILRRRFFDNEPMLTTCIDMGIGKDAYYRYRNTGVMYARECAIQLGLIKVFRDVDYK